MDGGSHTVAAGLFVFLDIDFCRLGTERIAVAGAAIFRAPRVRALDGALRPGIAAQAAALVLLRYGAAV